MRMKARGGGRMAAAACSSVQQPPGLPPSPPPALWRPCSSAPFRPPAGVFLACALYSTYPGLTGRSAAAAAPSSAKPSQSGEGCRVVPRYSSCPVECTRKKAARQEWMWTHAGVGCPVLAAPAQSIAATIWSSCLAGRHPLALIPIQRTSVLVGGAAQPVQALARPRRLQRAGVDRHERHKCRCRRFLLPHQHFAGVAADLVGGDVRAEVPFVGRQRIWVRPQDGYSHSSRCTALHCSLLPLQAPPPLPLPLLYARAALTPAASSKVSMPRKAVAEGVVSKRQLCWQACESRRLCKLVRNGKGTRVPASQELQLCEQEAESAEPRSHFVASARGRLPWCQHPCRFFTVVLMTSLCAWRPVRSAGQPQGSGRRRGAPNSRPKRHQASWALISRLSAVQWLWGAKAALQLLSVAAAAAACARRLSVLRRRHRRRRNACMSLTGSESAL